MCESPTSTYRKPFYLPERPENAQCIPLGQRTSLKLPCGQVHFGARNLIILFRLLTVCPLLQELDLSELSGMDDADPYKEAPSCNDVVAELSTLLTQHPSLRCVNLAHQPIATEACKRLVEAARTNKQLRSVVVDDNGVERGVLHELQRVLESNNKQPDALPTPNFSSTWEFLNSLPDVDRKSAAELQQLRLVLWEQDCCFGTLSGKELERAVLHAEPISLSQAVQHSHGLRGDDQHLFVVVSGEIAAAVGVQVVTLQRGDCFGERIESLLFTAGTVEVKQRGAAFRIPLSDCTDLLRTWESRAVQFAPLFRRAPFFQALPMWVVLRSCICSRDVSHAPGEAAVAPHKPFAGLFVVMEGSYVVPPRNAAMDLPNIIFTVGDLFGEEPAVIPHRSSYSVAVCAGPNGGKCVLIPPSLCIRHILPVIKPSLQLQAKTYSRNDA